MLPNLRQINPRAQPVTADFNRQRRHLGLDAVHQRDVVQTARRFKMRIIKQVFRPRDRCIRQTEFFATVHQFLLAHFFKNRGEDGNHARPLGDAHRIGLQRRIIKQFREAKRLAKHLPLRISNHTHEHLLALGGGESVIHRPRAHAIGHRHHGFTGHETFEHVLRHQKHIVFKQAALHILAFAGGFALNDGGEDGDGAEHAAHDVVHRRPCA